MFWQSKLLQTETALSTMENEIMALSAWCRELFPIIDMVRLLAEATNFYLLDIRPWKSSFMKTNSGTLVLAKTLSPQFIPQNKCYAIKILWLREEIFKRDIHLNKIDTVVLLGDILTKGLTRVVFEYLQKKIKKW